MSNLKIAVSGNIAVGKTTLCELLAKELADGYFMDEDHGINPFLNDFYEFMSSGTPGVNPFAFPMQQFFMNKRFERELAMGFKDGLLIQDRCMLEQLEIFNKAQNADGIMSDE